MTAAACPRCGSTDPAVRLHMCLGAVVNTWHDRPTGADDPAARLDNLIGDRACGGPSDSNYDPELLDVGMAAVDRLRELEAVEDDRVWLRAELDGLKARLNIAEGQYADRVREKAELREAGDALALRLAAHDDVGDDALLDRWEQTR